MGLAGILALGTRPTDGDDVMAAAMMGAALAGGAPDAGLPCRHGPLVVAGTVVADGSEEGPVAAALAGWIDNAPALRAELMAGGAAGPLDDDAALLRAAYLAWGAVAVQRLEGAFAFVLHDRARNLLICGRDRFGIEPFHYTVAGDRFLFASDAGAVAAAPCVRRAPDHEALVHYLVFGFCPPDRGALRGIERLAPAHLMVVDPAGAIRRQRYWDLAASASGETEAEEGGLARELAARLEAVVERSVSGREAAGLIVSNHAGSGALAAAAARVLPGIQTFALGERAAARGQDLPGSHHVVPLNPDAAVAALDLIPGRGEPLAALGAVGALALSQAAGERVATCLAPVGGQALFLDARRYREFEALMGAPPETRRLAGGRRGFYQTAPFARDLYTDLVCIFSDADCLSASGAALAHALLFSPVDEIGAPLEAADQGTAADLAARVDLTHGAARTLAALDVARHRPGLDMRAPLLDHGFADWFAALAPRTRIALGGGVPAQQVPAVRAECDDGEAGLRAGMDRLLRTGLRERVEDVLASTAFRSRGLFNLPWVEKLVSDHMNGHRSGAPQIWALLCLETWFVGVIDQPAARHPAARRAADAARMIVDAPVPHAAADTRLEHMA